MTNNDDTTDSDTSDDRDDSDSRLSSKDHRQQGPRNPDEPLDPELGHRINLDADRARAASVKRIDGYQAWMDRWTGASPQLLTETHQLLLAHYPDENVPSIEQLSFFGDEILLIIQTWAGHTPPDGLERMIRRIAGRVWSSDVAPYSEREWAAIRFWSGRATPEAVLYTLQTIRQRFGDHPALPHAFDLSLRSDALLAVIRDMIHEGLEEDGLPTLLDAATENLYGIRDAYSWHPSVTGTIVGGWQATPATPTGEVPHDYGPDPAYRSDDERVAGRHDLFRDFFNSPPPPTIEESMASPTFIALAGSDDPAVVRAYIENGIAFAQDMDPDMRDVFSFDAGAVIDLSGAGEDHALRDPNRTPAAPPDWVGPFRPVSRREPGRSRRPPAKRRA